MTTILGGFAGIGWAEGAQVLGLTETGIDYSASACTTRTAAGHATIHADITTLDTADHRGTTGVIMSPPCPSFSKSGNGAGTHDAPYVAGAIRDYARGHDTRQALRAACRDERSALTAEPMRWYHDLRPEWILMEQVPAVLPLWELYADLLQDWGYRTATGIVDAASYGLGQHRKRAVLIASQARPVALPATTHGGPGQLPLTAMRDTVGWGYTRRPSPTVTGGGTSTGGAEPFGNGSRRAMRNTADRDPALCVPGPRGWRPTVADCAALQGFRPGLQWHGTAGQQYLAIGNAVPPPLATVLIAEATGITARQPALAAA
ncbi:DNA cytosine methyltransferase [Kitasatospora sp. NPDC048239]|uniref:DNA cytosine methyltransferase n=1 Tax=Kitasatospora sp. NPDC048239 TaxID=3364046 RepID=UPI0037150DD1